MNYIMLPYNEYVYYFDGNPIYVSTTSTGFVKFGFYKVLSSGREYIHSGALSSVKDGLLLYSNGGSYGFITNVDLPLTGKRVYEAGFGSGVYSRITNISATVFESKSALFSAMDDGNWDIQYPITYHYTNSTVSGPSEAAVGDTVTVSAVPDNNYGITDPASQILVTNNDVAVEYQWNPSTNTITFVMPDPT